MGQKRALVMVDVESVDGVSARIPTADDLQSYIDEKTEDHEAERQQGWRILRVRTIGYIDHF